MAKKNIKTVQVVCGDGTKDYYVYLNPNTKNTDDKVQAFVDAFKSSAQKSSNICYGLPLKLILAMWGFESGWDTYSTQQSNQNWSNLGYNSKTNPVGNVGTDGRWAIFEGRNHFSTAFGKWFINNSRYSKLISYLKTTKSPSIDTCITHIANAGYCEGSPDAYKNEILACVKTLEKRSNIG